MFRNSKKQKENILMQFKSSTPAMLDIVALGTNIDQELFIQVFFEVFTNFYKVNFEKSEIIKYYLFLGSWITMSREMHNF